VIVANAHWPVSVLSAQSTFRAILDAVSRPGSVQPLAPVATAPSPLLGGVAAVALALADHDTPIWLDARLRQAEAAADWLRFQCGSQIVDDPQSAAFALAGAPLELPPLDRFNLGTAEYPDRSTTIVLQVDSLNAGSSLVLTGPGIQGQRLFRAAPLPNDMPARLTFNSGLFPRGVDLLLATSDQVAALPRSVRIVSEGG
jgi:alpha-D-ribose 1-methylphosphonate 5-triphosphate synthase subunit PhnH